MTNATLVIIIIITIHMIYFDYLHEKLEQIANTHGFLFRREIMVTQQLSCYEKEVT